MMLQVVHLRWWILTEVTVRKTDLSRIPTAETIFRIAHEVMVPGGKTGIRVTDTAASIPLQSLLNHTVTRYGMVRYGVVWCGMVWYGMVWYGMVWCGGWWVWYGVVWCGMVWC